MKTTHFNFSIPARNGKSAVHEIHVCVQDNKVIGFDLTNMVTHVIVWGLPSDINIVCRPVAGNPPSNEGDPRYRAIRDSLSMAGIPSASFAVSAKYISLYDNDAGCEANIPWDVWDNIDKKLLLLGFTGESLPDMNNSPRPVVSTENRFPHRCPKCYGPCYIGFMSVEHQSGACK